MTRIRYELGTDAVIISQRKIRKPGIKGLFSSKIIEVTAAVENEVLNEKKQNTVNDVTRSEDRNNNRNSENQHSNELNNIELNSIEAIKKVVQQENSNKGYSRVEQEQNNIIHKVPKQNEEQNDINPHNLMSEMMKMKTMISELSLKSELAITRIPNENQKSDIEKVLFDNDVDSENIENIMMKIKNNKTEVTDVEKSKIVLKEMINVTKPKLEGRIVLVGPTGVGKTTTIAKLAGRLALAGGKKVGLITVDTYRIGAVEQLKIYADIMNIPFKVVYNMNDMDKAIESMSECEVVLIDTTGRSSKNRMQIAELRTFVEKADTKNIQLVLSSTTKNKDMKYIIEGYQILNYNSIIVTKLDETSTYGSILNILETAKVPLSFVSTGQNVPDDIKELSADSIVSLILGEDTIC